MTNEPPPGTSAVRTPAPTSLPAALADDVRSALRGVIDPELGESIVDLGMVRTISVDDGTATIEVALTIAGCPLRNQIRSDVERRATGVPGVASVVVTTGAMSAEERAAVMSRARLKAQERSAVTIDLPPTTRVLAIASGKGGVGKSSVTVNLAVALAAGGLTIGVLDADVWGHSVPRLLGMEGGSRPVTRRWCPSACRSGKGS